MSGRLWVRPEVSPGGICIHWEYFVLLLTVLCRKNVGGSSKPDSGSSEENGRRLWREGDPGHRDDCGCGPGCIQVSSPSGLWEEE